MRERCSFVVIDETRPNLKQCSVCGRRVVLDTPAHRIVANHIVGAPKPNRVLHIKHKAKLPTTKPTPVVKTDAVDANARVKRIKAAMRGFAGMECQYRGDPLTTVPCGQCGSKDIKVEVSLCEKFGACASRTLALREAQKVKLPDGSVIHPKPCIYCPLWNPAPDK